MALSDRGLRRDRRGGHHRFQQDVFTADEDIFREEWNIYFDARDHLLDGCMVVADQPAWEKIQAEQPLYLSELGLLRLRRSTKKEIRLCRLRHGDSGVAQNPWMHRFFAQLPAIDFGARLTRCRVGFRWGPAKPILVRAAGLEPHTTLPNPTCSEHAAI